MMNAIEPIADAVTGAAAARAVEPDTGLDPSGHTTERNCLNCSAALVGPYCHACGQKGHVHRTLRAFAHDLAHGILHLDGKVWRTLPMLLVRPGELTRRYVQGERARFVSPLAMFLFSVFTMFAVMSLLGSPLHIMEDQTGQARSGMRQELARLDERLTLLRSQRDALQARGGDTRRIDGEIAEASTARSIVHDLAGAPPEAADPEAEATANQFETLMLGTGKVHMVQRESALGQAYRAAKENPRLLLYKLQTNAYKFSWALILLSTPFVALLFLWRRRPLYDHSVFVTYSITAVSILTIAAFLLALAGVTSGPLIVGAMLYVPWHMYRQLRGAYLLSRLSALWRTVFLLLFAAVALLLFTVGLVALGILG